MGLLALTYALWRDRFAEAIDTELYPLEWLDRRVEYGTARFWCSDRAAILAEINTYPSGAREVHGMVAAGELDAIKALIPLAEIWGRDCGCIRASIQSSPAWARLMASDGYVPEQMVIAKYL